MLCFLHMGEILIYSVFFLSILNQIKMNQLCKQIHEQQVQRAPEAAQEKAT